MDLGMAYLTGDGVTRDPVVALQWIEQAAALEHNDALSALGTFYLNGSEGYDKDISKGVFLLEKAYMVIHFAQPSFSIKSFLGTGTEATACCIIRQKRLPTDLLVRRLKRKTYSSRYRCKYWGSKRP